MGGFSKAYGGFVKGLLPELRGVFGLAEDASHTQVNKALTGHFGGRPRFDQVEDLIRNSPSRQAAEVASAPMQAPSMPRFGGSASDIQSPYRQSAPRPTIGPKPLSEVYNPSSMDFGGLENNPSAFPLRNNAQYENDVRSFVKERKGAGAGNVAPGVGVKPIGDVFDEAKGGPFRQTMASAGNALFRSAGGLDKDVMDGALKVAMHGAAGAMVGSTAGLVGQMALPDNMEYTGFLNGAMKGAVLGGALGIAGKFSGGMVNKINDLKLGDHGAFGLMKSAGKMTQKIASTPYATAIAVGAGALGSFETHLTRPINQV